MQNIPTPDTVQVSIGLWLLVLIVLLVPASDLFAQEGYVVADVNFSGNERLSSDQLKEQIAMHGTGGLLGLFSDEEDFLYSRDALEADVERLTRHYQRQGFLNVSLPEPKLQINHDDEQVKVTFIISEGQPVIVDTIILTLQSQSDTITDVDSTVHVDSLLQQVRSELKLSHGVRFRDDMAEQDRRALA
ncbi:hypothetical protein GF356_10010, partial [candidate division GN15 bacterium]|nr:hypothetical protein [candidate division GN15 bacterium]